MFGRRKQNKECDRVNILLKNFYSGAINFLLFHKEKIIKKFIRCKLVSENGIIYIKFSAIVHIAKVNCCKIILAMVSRKLIAMNIMNKSWFTVV